MEREEEEAVSMSFSLRDINVHSFISISVLKIANNIEVYTQTCIFMYIYKYGYPTFFLPLPQKFTYWDPTLAISTYERDPDLLP